MLASAALTSMAQRVVTAPLSQSVAQGAAELEDAPEFPRDPADRLIFATAADRSIRLVTADSRMRRFSAQVCLW